MDRQEFLDEASSLKFWIFQNKTKCLTFAAIVVVADRLFHALVF